MKLIGLGLSRQGGGDLGKHGLDLVLEKRRQASGSHHIFVHPDIPEMINLQSVAGEAKPYQIRQFLRLVERYNLKLECGRP